MANQDAEAREGCHSRPHAMFALIDLRDMQCAQALATAAQAMQRLPAGAALELVCNAADVRDDLVAWAAQLAHPVLSAETSDGDTWLKIQKRDAADPENR